MRSRHFLTTFLLLLALSVSGVRAYAQETEAEVAQKAIQLFEQQKFVEATPLYLRLLALNPLSHDYNFRYGTCLLYNSVKKQDAFKYLNYSVQDAGTDITAFYYLGKAYHLNYQFNEAIKNYELYKQKAGPKPKQQLDVDRQIEMCQNGKRLLTTITDIIVLEKKEIVAESFFRIYKLNNIGGDFLVASKYQSKIDKKKGHVPLVHFPANAKAIYFSSYGDTDSGQKDIYVIRQLPTGEWSLPQAVNGAVNTRYDEDYPYMHPSGEFLYFCSRGHNSMGGYDVFRSRLDPETGSFGPPENMDFAISSPDDDLLYVVDSLNENAWFASSRQSSNGKIFVYNVRVDRVPLQLAVVKGNFSSDINPANKKVSIAVTDYASGEKIGNFSSNEKGNYLITFPKGGKYTYEIKVEGKPQVHKYLVSIPFSKEFRPLKQKMIEELKDESEVVRVLDLFNEDVEDIAGVLAEVIKMRSELNPNANQFDLDSLDEQKNNAKILAELGFQDASPQQIASHFDAVKEKQEEKVETQLNLINGANQLAVKNATEAEKLQSQGKDLAARASAAETDQQKYELFEAAREKLNRAAELKDEARDLIAFADSVQKKVAPNQDALNKITAINSEVRKAISEEKMTDLKEIISGNTAFISEISKSGSGNPQEALAAERSALQQEKRSLEQQQSNYNASVQNLNKEIEGLTVSLEAAKAKDKPAIQSTIDSKTAERELVKEELQRLEKKIAQTEAKIGAVEDKMEFLNSVTSVQGETSTSESAKTALAKADDQNSRTLQNYVEQQVKTLQNSQNIVAEPKATDFIADYTAQMERASGGTPAERTHAQNALDQELLTKIETEIIRNDQLLQSDPENQQIKDKISALQNLKNTTASNITERQNQLAQNTSGGEKSTPESELRRLAPEYTSEMSGVTSASSEERLRAENEIDEALLSRIEEELQRTENQLQSKPGDEQLREKLTSLQTLKSTTEDKIAERDARLSSSENNSQNTGITAATEIERLSPDYESRLNSVTADSPAERLRAENEIDQELKATVEKELLTNQRTLQKEPGNLQAQGREAALNELLVQTQERIADRNKELAELETRPATEEITAESELNRLAPDYQLLLEKVSGTNLTERLLGENEVDKKLIPGIEREIVSAREIVRTNPADSVAKTRLDALEELKTTLETRIADRNDRIASEAARSNQPATTVDREIVKVFPEYGEKMAAVPTDDRREMLMQQNTLDEQLLRRAKEELAELEGQQLRNPSDSALVVRMDTLQALVNKLQLTIDERNEALSQLDLAVVEPDNNAQIEALRPEYNDNIEKITRTISAGPERERKLLQEDEKLLTAISEKEKALRNAIDTEPTNKDLLLALTATEELKAVQESTIAERKSEMIARARQSADTLKILQSADRNYSRDASLPAEKQLKNEKQHLADIDAAIKSNSEKLEKEFDPEMLVENEVLQSEREATLSRIETLQSPLATNATADSKLRSDLGTGYDRLMVQTPGNSAVARDVLQSLREYEAALESRMNELPADSPEKPLVSEQLRSVRRRIGVVEANLEEMSGTTDVAATVARRNELENKLNDPNLTSKEKKELSKEVEQLTAEITAAESSRIEQEVAVNRSDIEAKQNQLARGTSPVAQSQSRHSDPVNEKLPAADQLQQTEERKSLLENVVHFDEATARFQKDKLVVSTPDELRGDRRRFLIEIGELEREISALEGKEPNSPRLEQMRNERTDLEEAVKQIDVMLSELEGNKTLAAEPTVSDNVSVTYEQEREIASNPEYRRVKAVGQSVEDVRRELAFTEKEKDAVRREIASEPDPAKKEGFVAVLEVLNEQSNDLRNTLISEQQRFDEEVKSSNLPEDAVRNLIARGVEPITPQPVVIPEALKTGFAIVENTQNAPSARELKLESGLPRGLVYRVQVGAFAKPVPEDRFKEFTPVTGEKLPSGITRYMAGYFGQRQSALDAMTAIRNLGYKDAFPVAYCDGERISLAEAKRLEEAGLCKAIDQDSLALQLVARETGAERVVPEVRPGDYNKAPGAVVAEAAEEKQGLFYTVQVGVYNRPATSAQLREIEPLITKRLPNGQIRYSSGVFASAGAARPKRQEAVTRGISDAFIVAYYKGERISLDEAARLLTENGEQILEPVQERQQVVQMDSARVYVAENPVMVTTGNQLVSRELYPVYPAAELSRLNTNGSYYYDAADQRIKSTEIAVNTPQIADSSLEIAAVERNFERKSAEIVSVWRRKDMSGALADWLLHATERYDVTETGSGFEIRFAEVEDDQRRELESTLRAMGGTIKNEEN